MGKRSEFKRRKHDFYATPAKAVDPLRPHLPVGPLKYAEVCAGDGSLMRHLNKAAVAAYDINPQAYTITRRDALTLTRADMHGAQMIITNPPWTRQLLHPMIDLFTRLVPETWLLFDSDWAFTKQAIPYLQRCADIVPVGRVKWIEGSKHVGKDNAAWYRFVPQPTPTIFHAPVK